MMMAPRVGACALALLAGCAYLAALPAALASECPYWGVAVGCSYDGRHSRPERCKGGGRRYCDRAPEAEECPKACQARNCRRNREDTHQFHSNHFKFKWEDLVLANDYDMVFTEGKEVCVQSCWRAPWNSKCSRTRRYAGRNYCVKINCEHDDLNRHVGCHKDFPWHKPTCDECNRLFPRACGEQLQRYVEDTEPSDEYKDFRGYVGGSDVAKTDDDDDRKRRNSDDSDSSDSDDDDDDDDDRRKRGRNCDDSSDSGANCRVGPDDAPTANDSFDFMDEQYPVLHMLDGVDYLSFNEIVFQVSGYAADVSKPGFAAAVAEIAGVPVSQVQTAQVVDVPVTSRSSAAGNATEEEYEAPEPIATVTVVVWSANPFGVDDRMDAILDKGEMYGKMQAAGVQNYLGASMTSNILAAPVSAMQAIFPEAMSYAKQQAAAAAASSSRAPSSGIIAIAAGCSLFAIGLLGATAIFVAKNLAAKRAQAQAVDDKLTSLEDAADPAVAAAAPAEGSVEERKCCESHAVM